jgi:hypothetical protein
LSVKVTERPLVVRAHPSGVEIVKPPVFDVNGTKAALSGMSPGGLLSTGIGDSVGSGDSEDPALGEVVPGAGGLVTAGFVGAALVGDRPPQALNRSVTVSPIHSGVARGMLRIVLPPGRSSSHLVYVRRCENSMRSRAISRNPHLALMNGCETGRQEAVQCGSCWSKTR